MCDTFEAMQGMLSNTILNVSLNINTEGIQKLMQKLHISLRRQSIFFTLVCIWDHHMLF